MKPTLSLLIASILSLSSLNSRAIIPLPNQMIKGKEASSFSLDQAQIVAKQTKAQDVANFFDMHGKGSKILLELSDKVKNPEGYVLEIGKKDAKIIASTDAGLFYGMQSLLQMPTDSTITITDEPRFAYRGMHIDPCRHFLPVEEVKKHIDILAKIKINRLHFHLTDDQGWRMEIKKYPKLTEIGATRIDGEGTEHEGFYTQDQLRDIVDYAAKRHITVIPEIELPGHGIAAIAAYPWLSCHNDTVPPRIIWGVDEIVMCPGKESTFQFLQDVMDEVCDIFPSTYVHIGGDECPKDSWKNCPLCQARIKEENLKSEEALQAYVIRRMEDYLASKGRRIIGWDEILEGGGSPNATIMSWRGIEGGIEAARTGRDAIMTPGEYMYFDKYQGDYRTEPVTIGGLLTLEKCYSYEPVPKELADAALGHHVLGVQANNWSEYIYSPEILDLRAYPRMLAVSEIGWTRPELKNYGSFYDRMLGFLPALDDMGVNYFIPRPQQPSGSLENIAFADTTRLTLISTSPIAIYYLWEGEEKKYDAPVVIDRSGDLETWTQLPSGKCSPRRTIHFTKLPYLPATEPGSEADTVYFSQMTLTPVPGKFLTMADGFDKAPKLEPFEVSDVKEIRNQPGCSSELQGLVYVPADGVYRFSTLNEELWVDGRKIVDNGGKVKRYVHSDATLPLARGLHPFKAIFLDHIIGGWPSRWNPGDIKVTRQQ